MLPSDKAQRLKEVLLDRDETAFAQPQRRGSSSGLVGLTLVTSAALLFGVVAACVKAISLPTLVLQVAIARSSHRRARARHRGRDMHGHAHRHAQLDAHVSTRPKIVAPLECGRERCT